MFKNMG